MHSEGNPVLDRDIFEISHLEPVLAIPVARPVVTTGQVLAQRVHESPPSVIPPGLTMGLPAGPYPPLPRTHPAAIASAFCGFTALIPIVCQVAGIALGVLALVRIQRDRRKGVPTGGTGLAIAGISFSAVALAGWILLAIMMAGVGTAFQNIDAGLGGALG